MLFDDDCLPACPPHRCSAANVFGRIRVRPTIQFGTVVEFLLRPEFTQSYQAVLEVGHTASGTADDWTPVGLPAENATLLVDDTQRVYGKTQWTHYRIRLHTATGDYLSQPQHCWGDLSQRSWRLVLNRERIWRVQLERTVRGQRGFLLKRRLVGARPEPGQGIIDYQTFEVLDPQAAETRGTEFLGGYYRPIPCVYADLSGKARREHQDDGGMRGTVNDLPRVSALFLAVPQLDSYDVWVSANNDFRWAIHTIEHTEELDGVPIVVMAELRLLPFTDPVYSIPLADSE